MAIVHTVFYSDTECAEIDCSDCGGGAIANDNGVYCPNCADE